ncbi:hypothetical protein ELH65_09135 [Rhizobium ruizarguesonis]|nr:hypothetical protein ELH65_09135 [Rhizobium ruizarguesonis]
MITIRAHPLPCHVKLLQIRAEEVLTIRRALIAATEEFDFVNPKLVTEVEYRAWTHDGKLRHASYKGLRDSAEEATVYEIID